MNIVLDTNIVLDLFVFKDPVTDPLRVALQNGRLQWIATQPMRDELVRVLGYPKIAQRLTLAEGNAADVLARFDALVRMHSVAPKASVTCKDCDDQKFIDLAVAHRTQLLSKDRAVICMEKRLLALGVTTKFTINSVA